MSVTSGKRKDRISTTNWYVYCLELEGGNYYIGATVDPVRRFDQHLIQAKYAASFTKKHRPKRVIEIIDTGYKDELSANRVEDTLTIKYMNKFGTKNVRGGRFLGSDEQVLRKYIGNRNILFNEIEFYSKYERVDVEVTNEKVLSRRSIQGDTSIEDTYLHNRLKQIFRKYKELKGVEVICVAQLKVVTISDLTDILLKDRYKNELTRQKRINRILKSYRDFCKNESIMINEK